MLVVLGCRATTDSDRPQVPMGKPGAILILKGVVSAQSSDEIRVEIVQGGYPSVMASWMSRRADELCKELSLPPVPLIRIYNREPPVIIRAGIGLVWVAGYFWDKSKYAEDTLSSIAERIDALLPTEQYVLDIWIREPDGVVIASPSVKQTFYHEFLHYWDTLTKKSWPADHNKEYEDRIKAFGWI